MYVECSRLTLLLRVGTPSCGYGAALDGAMNESKPQPQQQQQQQQQQQH